MPARLIVYPPDRPSRVWPMWEGRAYVVGRDPAVEIPVDDDRVSRRHARLEGGEDEGWRVRDLGSKNGVEIGGRSVGESELASDVWLSLGGVLARFQEVGESELADDAGRRWRQWRTSAELQRRLDPSLGVDGLLQRLLESVLRLSDTERGFVLLAGEHEPAEAADRATDQAADPAGDREGPATPEGEGFGVAASRGATMEDLASAEMRERGFPGSSGVVRRVLETGRATATSDAAAETWLGARASVLRGGIRALVCLPLEADTRRLGVVYADSREPGALITDLDLEVLQALAEHAALALAVARIDREMERLAEILESAPASDAPDRDEILRHIDRLRCGSAGRS